MWTQYGIAFCTAAGVALLATPAARWMAVRWGINDLPGGRKIHLRPTPLLGGVAIYLGCLLAFAFFGPHEFRALGALIGATVILLVGLWDDLSSLSPWSKLAGQVLAAGFLLPFGIRIGLTGIVPLDAALTIIWVVGVTNSINLLDGLDGLAAGVSAIAAWCFMLVAGFGGQPLVALAAAALCGACLGFLWYNVSPAQIFMGDTGSMFIGYLLAILAVRVVYDAPHPVIPLAPILILGLPLFDTGFVIVTRIARGRSPVEGGKDHCFHRVVASGVAPRRAVPTFYVIASVLGAAGIWLTPGLQGSGWAVAPLGLPVLALGLQQILAPRRRRLAPAQGTPR